MSEIFQSKLPEEMRIERALPGVQPLDMRDWLRVDDAYAEQMGERIRLMAHKPDAVRATTAGSHAAVCETLDLIIEAVQELAGFQRDGDQMRCPDGRCVDLSGDPLLVMGEIIQEDICILEKPKDGSEHFLSAALLCFPAHWTLSEKIGKPMGRIHKPVEEYDENIRRRVQRLFDGVQVDRPLWRFNRAHAGASLFQPRLEKDYGTTDMTVSRDFLRSERQCLVRLPKTRAVVFSIHTYVIDLRPA
ncbi:DUF3445 domain-containing protein [Planktotalea sp.]|uniref:heme-dependent oxidative N-demethylase family protein n=1 Tax=Planktotalea sp. TaxID=2029877 RepID=UPI0035C81245